MYLLVFFFFFLVMLIYSCFIFIKKFKFKFFNGHHEKKNNKIKIPRAATNLINSIVTN